GGWKLAEDYQLDALIAKRDTLGAFAYLEGAGFTGAPFVREAPAYESEDYNLGKTFGAYFSSSRSGATGYFYYALTDTGDRWVAIGAPDDCGGSNPVDCDNFPGFAGAMCVRANTTDGDAN